MGSSHPQGLQPSQNIPEAALESYTQGLAGFAAAVVTHPSTTGTHVHVFMVLWSSASPRLGYGMDWLSAGAVGNEDEERVLVRIYHHSTSGDSVGHLINRNIRNCLTLPHSVSPHCGVC